ncbi:hypothetical protein HN51_005712 [Arachis hypogaea]
MLEISINMIDACCKYFLDDLASRNQQTIRLAYMYFSFFIAVRNELGYFAVFFRRFDVMLMPRVLKSRHYLRRSHVRGKRKMIDGQRLNASGNISDHEWAEKTDVTDDGGCAIQLSCLVRVLLVNL